jgi:V8-like Glu-specific endopeptidase
MKLKSIARPSNRKRPSARVAASGTAAAPKKALVTDKVSRKLLAVGKSTTSLVRGQVLALAVLGSDDERTRIRQTEAAPWRMICALGIKVGAVTLPGTGWLAGPCTVVTAGHCVFNPAFGGDGWADQITVAAGLDGEEQPFPPLFTTELFTNARWKNDLDPDFDFGAIRLPQRLGDELGWFQAMSMPDEELRDFLINISGYPGERGNGSEQWWAKNRVRALLQRRILYDVDTSPGQSGSPAFVFRSIDEAPLVVGVHAYDPDGTPSNIPLNSAPRLTPDIIGLIQGWIDADNAAS